ncbi:MULTISPECIES: hypothetical protein [unclassified Bacillus (in: firmicutes)]|uniref:hypothetical protein n=1 Tax=unclassified Bacillus (in: firmicutes) TaxID=185979 RepID=UPI0008EF6BE5|nr:MULTISPECIES: hypothetical protein [unclassified Bacillus (in: firmicutes)]SFA99471.1 hypothetical protein SAMN02799634_103444 [Bacillus sp. UNCCL13]SFQ81662.1 hypothetical protein SAMN04488577_2075 [Bacillus sp. cl95]
MPILTAEIRIRGVKPLLFNHFNIDSIPLEKREREGVPGNNPDEWKKTFLVTEEGQFYLEPRYVYSCIRAGGKHLPRGRGSFEPYVSACLEVMNSKILINRFIPPEDLITRDNRNTVYIDVQPVSRRGAKNIRYRLALTSGWETDFKISWEGSLINRQQMESICRDAGTFAGLGDGRKIGFGRFAVTSFDILEGV